MKRVFSNSNSHRRSLMRVLGVVSWSLLMVALGSQLTLDRSLGLLSSVIPTAVAANSESTSPAIIRLDRERLSGKNLGSFAPYEPEAGNLVAKGHDYFYSADGNFALGVWESKPGQMTYENLQYDELMYVLEGSMIMTDSSGQSTRYDVGEGLVLPRGWSGTLAVPEGGVRKIWVSYEGGIKGGIKGG